MAYPMGEANPGPLRVDFDRRLKLEFHGNKITSDTGLLAYREPAGAGLAPPAERPSSRTRLRFGRVSNAPSAPSQAANPDRVVTISLNAQLCYRLRCLGGTIWEIPAKDRIFALKYQPAGI